MSVQSHNEHDQDDALRPTNGKNIDLSFLPKVLFDKCRPFIIQYHELNGYSCLADILWHPETRRFLELNFTLRRLFKSATWARRAKKSKDGLVTIAAVILSTEILATGFAGWGSRYPGAQKKARKLLDEHIPSSRAWLLERYLFQEVQRSRQALWISVPIYHEGRNDGAERHTESIVRSDEQIILPNA
jgi:hypothetical protein